MAFDIFIRIQTDRTVQENKVKNHQNISNLESYLSLSSVGKTLMTTEYDFAIPPTRRSISAFFKTTNGALEGI
jgi:hypothetical protein